MYVDSVIFGFTVVHIGVKSEHPCLLNYAGREPSHLLLVQEPPAMRSRFSLMQLASTCARHPQRVVAFWAAIFLAAAVIAGLGLSGVLSNAFSLTTNDDSVVGLQRLNDSSLSDSIGYSETIVITARDGLTVDDPAFRTQTDAVVAGVRTLQGEWAGTGPTAAPDLLSLSQNSITGSYVLDYFEIQDLLSNPQVAALATQMGGTEQIDALVSADRTTLLIPVVFDTYPESIRDYIDVVDQFDSDQFTVTTIGNLSINEVYQ